jgi:hypothetical protein
VIGSLAGMARQMRLDPDLQAVVERARELARKCGELRDTPWTPPTDLLPAEAREALRDWVTSGDYDRTVAELVAHDPDLATQL